MAGKTSKKSAKVAKKAAAKRVAAKATKPRKTAPKAQSRKVALLSGGNPQIAKADGDAYIAAMPGWKRDVGRRLDALIVRTVPGRHKSGAEPVADACLDQNVLRGMSRWLQVSLTGVKVGR